MVSLYVKRRRYEVYDVSEFYNQHDSAGNICHHVGDKLPYFRIIQKTKKHEQEINQIEFKSYCRCLCRVS